MAVHGHHLCLYQMHSQEFCIITLHQISWMRYLWFSSNASTSN